MGSFTDLIFLFVSSSASISPYALEEKGKENHQNLYKLFLFFSIVHFNGIYLFDCFGGLLLDLDRRKVIHTSMGFVHTWGILRHPLFTLYLWLASQTIILSTKWLFLFLSLCPHNTSREGNPHLFVILVF